MKCVFMIVTSHSGEQTGVWLKTIRYDEKDNFVSGISGDDRRVGVVCHTEPEKIKKAMSNFKNDPRLKVSGEILWDEECSEYESIDDSVPEEFTDPRVNDIIKKLRDMGCPLSDGDIMMINDNPFYGELLIKDAEASIKYGGSLCKK